MKHTLKKAFGAITAVLIILSAAAVFLTVT